MARGEKERADGGADGRVSRREKLEHKHGAGKSQKPMQLVDEPVTKWSSSYIFLN
jgi:hypothetical protein